MISIKNYNDPFQSILDFESAIAEYTSAPYCVTTDCCTHAIEIALRLTHQGQKVKFPARTYLSIVMLMHKLKIEYELEDTYWRERYQIQGTNIWDSARYFQKEMYEPDSIQCVSFGLSKPLEIGKGGCILTDDPILYKEASRMRYDGRDIFAFSPWATQKKFKLGFHYYLRPEECVKGLDLLQKQQFNPQLEKHYNYPDCREIEIE